MEQFNYDEWKKNPKRKVVTRTGEEVTITGYKTNYYFPVEVLRNNGRYEYYSKKGEYLCGAHDECDLFFAYDSIYIPQPEATNGLCWRKCKAGYKFPSDAIVIPDDERTTDRDPRLVRCAVWNSKYILVDELKKLPVENG